MTDYDPNYDLRMQLSYGVSPYMHHEVPPDQPVPTLDEQAHMDAQNARAIQVMNRFAELADADYWRDIEAAKVNRRIAAALLRIEWTYDAARFDNTAFELERSVERRRAQMYAQIESEMK